MTELMSEYQKIELAWRTLPPEDAEIFILHHWGDPKHPDPTRRIHWTYSQIAAHLTRGRFGQQMSFSTISKSLKRSAPLMLAAAIEEDARLRVSCITGTEGLSEDDVPANWRITLQFGHEAKGRVDTTAKKAIGATVRRQERQDAA
jgi:hypothetical protein